MFKFLFSLILLIFLSNCKEQLPEIYPANLKKPPPALFLAEKFPDIIETDKGDGETDGSRKVFTISENYSGAIVLEATCPDYHFQEDDFICTNLPLFAETSMDYTTKKITIFFLS